MRLNTKNCHLRTTADSSTAGGRILWIETHSCASVRLKAPCRHHQIIENRVVEWIEINECYCKKDLKSVAFFDSMINFIAQIIMDINFKILEL